MTKPLTKPILEKFLLKATQSLSGDWILVGGTVLGILEPELRVTMDIDIVPKNRTANEQRLKLMSLAEDVGLPVEAINLAAEHFVKKHKGWEKELVLIREGKSCRIFRPNAGFYVLLKIERLSETDLADVLAMLKYARREGEKIDQSVWKTIESKHQNAEGPKKERLQQILNEQTRFKE